MGAMATVVVDYIKVYGHTLLPLSLYCEIYSSQKYRHSNVSATIESLSSVRTEYKKNSSIAI